MKEIFLIIFGVIFSFGLMIWRFKFMTNKNPNTDLLLKVLRDMLSYESCGHQKDGNR